MEIVVDGMQRFVVDQRKIVDKLSNRQEFLISIQGVNQLGMFGQPCANSLIDKKLGYVLQLLQIDWFGNLEI
jgi:hypothetical protein